MLEDSERRQDEFLGQSQCRNKKIMYFFGRIFFYFFYTVPKGLHWEELEEWLNPNFDWEAAVQKTLGTDDSLIEVCCLAFVCIGT